MTMFRRLITIIVAIAFMTETAHPDLVVVATTDVHGNFFPYNFIEGKPWGGSMSRVATYIDSLREQCGAENLLLLDNGDILQGQPPAYYSNFIDTSGPNLAAEVYRFLGVDAATIGNHDIETGHDVYDRWIKECSPMPVLGANIIDTSTGLPYLKPYAIFNRGGMRVAVIGLITPAIPAWLAKNLWEGMRFDDMVGSARYWVDRVRRDEAPDVVIGLFHSGADASHSTAEYVENASLQVAREVDGFDLIIFGHDHKRHISIENSPEGSPVVALNPANNARAVAKAVIRRTPEGKIEVEGSLVEMDRLVPSKRFGHRFGKQISAVKKFVSDTVGYSSGIFASRDAFFGPSAFMQLIHRLQLEITGADISMAAPLSLDGVIKAGPLTIADMFTLYKYENMLYTMELTGREIQGYLEKSYGGWVGTMTSPDDHMLLLDPDTNDDGRPGLATPFYNYDSAFGIDYTVDLTQPVGQKVIIRSFSNGEPFYPDSIYRVAINSYRGNGGGDLLTLGAGISPDKLAGRVIWATERDMRYYLMEAIRKAGTISPEITYNWRFIPEEYARSGKERDMRLLFPKNN